MFQDYFFLKFRKLSLAKNLTIMKYFLLQDDKVLVSVDSKSGQEVIEVDNVLAMVGYRPDTTITEELQVFNCNQKIDLILSGILFFHSFIHFEKYRPSLQVHYCYATEGPMKLAAALMAAGGGGGDCLAQVVLVMVMLALILGVLPCSGGLVMMSLCKMITMMMTMMMMMMLSMFLLVLILPG